MAPTLEAATVDDGGVDPNVMSGREATSASNQRPRGGRRGGRQDRAPRGRGSQTPRGRSTNSRPPRTEDRSENHASMNGATRPMPHKDRAASMANGQSTGADESEAEVCFICASRVVHHSISPCNHRTCHICTLRMRALYQTKACAHCRTTSEYVIFTDDGSKNYEQFRSEDFVTVDQTLGVKYEKQEIHQDTVLLLRFNCPDAHCDVACLGWPDLYRHVKTEHNRVMCNLCTRNKKVFTHEHELFTYSELRKHERFGDDHPGAVDQSGFRGHPECGFCRQRFYGDDELYTHCREKHERCHICDRRNQGRQQQYLVDYAALEQHFRQDHFLCPDQECLDKKFVVFESEMDLKAHQLEAHPNGLSKDARKEARRVDMSGFDYRSPHARGGRSDRPGNRGQGGGGRGRDPNAEPLPASSAQPLGRAELAFQRQLAIQSAQSTSARTFGAHLTSSAAPFATRPNDAANQAGTRATAPGSRTQISHDNGYPSIGSLSLGGHSDPTPTQPSSSARDQALSPQEQARRARHAAVMERALKLLRHDQTPFDEFRAKVSSFQRSSISASELVEFFYTLFDTSLADLGKLINELADIYENPSKRTALLQAWNDWKATREDYPALPGPSGAAASLSSSSSSLGSGGTRVLRLKSSTAQSSRSAVNRQGSWGSSQTGSEPFPAMASSSQASRAGPTNAPFWASSLGSSTAAAPAPPRPSNAANARSHAIASAEAFPALPAAAKPATTIFGYGTGAVRRDVGRGAPSTNAWAASSSSSSADAAAAAAEQEEGGKKKGKANKKQMLFHFG